MHSMVSKIYFVDFFIFRTAKQIYYLERLMPKLKILVKIAVPNVILLIKELLVMKMRCLIKSLPQHSKRSCP